MSELNDFFKAMAKAKVEDPKHKIVKEAKEAAAGDLSSLFSQLSQVAAKDPKQQLVKHVRESIQEDLGALFTQLEGATKKEDLVVEESLVEEVQFLDEVAPVEPIEEAKVEELTKTPVEAAIGVEKYLRALPKDSHSFQQPIEQQTNAEMKAILDKLKFMEQWLGKISAAGPGGGAGDVISLDHQTRLVNSASYTIGRKDYYIGVNYEGRVTLTLPSLAKDGRYIIIKDESGRASVYPITVQGTVDNDPNGFVLAMNNGAIQMIYRNGWRIV